MNKHDKKSVEVYQLMMDLLRAEEQCVNNVRQSEREVLDMLEDRVHEEITTELSVSIYDTQRNDKAKKHREMLVCDVILSPIHTADATQLDRRVGVKRLI